MDKSWNKHCVNIEMADLYILADDRRLLTFRVFGGDPLPNEVRIVATHDDGGMESLGIYPVVRGETRDRWQTYIVGPVSDAVMAMMPSQSRAVPEVGDAPRRLTDDEREDMFRRLRAFHAAPVAAPPQDEIRKAQGG